MAPLCAGGGRAGALAAFPACPTATGGQTQAQGQSQRERQKFLLHVVFLFSSNFPANGTPARRGREQLRGQKLPARPASAGNTKAAPSFVTQRRLKSMRTHGLKTHPPLALAKIRRNGYNRPVVQFIIAVLSARSLVQGRGVLLPPCGLPHFMFPFPILPDTSRKCKRFSESLNKR